jgi:DNA ligase-1
MSRGIGARPDGSENARVLLEEIARTSEDVAGTSGRLAKVERLADCLRGLRPDEVPVAVAYLSGELPHDAIGVGWALLRDLPPGATAPSLELLEVDAALRRIGSAAGPGSHAARRDELAGLVARAAGVPVSDVRRALMVAGDLGEVAAAAIADGTAGLAGFRLTPLRPLQPMLAQTAGSVQEALDRVGPAALEWKLDGARLQVHRLGGEVRAFTRNLADVTDRVPEVVETIRQLSLEAAVLDGEAIALDGDGRPRPFQVTMSRFGSRRGVEELRETVALTFFVFDCLHLDGDDLLDRPARQRFAALTERVPENLRVPRLETEDAAEAERFLDDALEHGHEGVMVKALDAPYEAGRRGGSWLKVKRTDTLDLVVLAAEWGHGRRQGWLSNLHLGARDPATGGFVMLGKTFKGMTDAMLAWQTERLLELETRRDSYTVHVRPELVVEVAFDGVQASRRYPGGLALRFARVKGYRPDKAPSEADTIDTVRAVHAGERRAG